MKNYLLYLVSTAAVGISAASAQLINENDLVPNQRIISAHQQPVEMFTGLQYTMGVKSILEGYGTYTTKESKGGHYMQVAVTKLEKYRRGGEWRNSALFSFWPTEVSNYYSMGVQSIPEGYVTYTEADSRGGKYMQIAKKELENYKVGQPWRDSALWALWTTEVPNYYTIGIRSIPEGYMTYTEEESQSGKYMQIAQKDLENYKAGKPWRDSALWAFWSSNYQLQGTIHNFNYTNLTQTLQDSMNNLGQIDLVRQMEFRNHGNATLQETFRHTVETVNKYSWVFDESTSLHLSDTFTLNASAGASFLGIINAQASTTNVFSWDWQQTTHQRREKTVEERKVHQIDQQITVPPHSHVKATALIKWIRDITIPFTADLEITATADRVHKNGSIVPNAPVGVEVVKHFLKYENCDYLQRIIRETNKSVVVPISGTLKVDAGVETIFSTEDVI